jgi:TRAP transporter TAXI family solute receptor
MTTRLRLIVVGIAVCAFAAFAWWLSGIWSPTPPRTLTMATGPEGGASAVIAQRYREVLARAGVEVRLRATAGSVENLSLLRDPASGVGAGFLQAGITSGAESPDLVSLGTVFYEPLWLFHRDTLAGLGLEALHGKRLAIGPEGSGTRVLALRLLGRLGIDEGNTVLLPLASKEAADALIAGTIDFVAIVTSWEAPVVRRLIMTPGIELASFPRADAHVALNPYLNKVVLPAGVADLERNIPPADVVLLAPKSSLVVRRELHPALQYLLLDAASELHSRPGLFNRAGEFPAAEAIDLPLAEGAQQFYKTGRPFLQRHLPFWLAALTERLLFLLVPLIGVVVPLFRWVPGLYVWNIRRRVFNLYIQLKLIELESDALPAGAAVSGLLGRLETLETRAERLRVPKFHASIVYTFRHHVRLVRDRVEQRSRQTPAT